jgi:hypothetical protein
VETGTRQENASTGNPEPVFDQAAGGKLMPAPIGLPARVRFFVRQPTNRCIAAKWRDLPRAAVKPENADKDVEATRGRMTYFRPYEPHHIFHPGNWRMLVNASSDWQLYLG